MFTESGTPRWRWGRRGAWPRGPLIAGVQQLAGTRCEATRRDPTDRTAPLAPPRTGPRPRHCRDGRPGPGGWSTEGAIRGQGTGHRTANWDWAVPRGLTVPPGLSTTYTIHTTPVHVHFLSYMQCNALSLESYTNCTGPAQERGEQSTLIDETNFWMILEKDFCQKLSPNYYLIGKNERRERFSLPDLLGLH